MSSSGGRGRGRGRREMARVLPRLYGMPDDDRDSDYRSARTITGSDYRHYGGVYAKDLSNVPGSGRGEGAAEPQYSCWARAWRCGLWCGLTLGVAIVVLIMAFRAIKPPMVPVPPPPAPGNHSNHSHPPPPPPKSGLKNDDAGAWVAGARRIELNSGWTLSSANGSVSVPAVVPGDAHAALEASGCAAPPIPCALSLRYIHLTASAVAAG